MSEPQADFVPSRPLRRSEFHVDFATIKTHIDEQRRLVESAGAAYIGRILVLANAQLPTSAIETEMALALERAIDRTVEFGFVSAQTEIRRMRATPLLAESPLPRGYKFPDAGRHGSMARTMAGTYRIVSMRARVTAASVCEQAMLHRLDIRGPGIFARAELHRCALGCVGEALNLGRAAGARNYGIANKPSDQLALAEAEGPPEFAMRSEALDERTCSECDSLHGEIVPVDSSEYWELMPPAYCEGGDRCRGVYVFEDGPAPDVRGPSGEPGPQPRPPEVPPVTIPPSKLDLHPGLNREQTEREVAKARSRVSTTRSRLTKSGADVQRAQQLERTLRRQEKELQQLQQSLSVKTKRLRSDASSAPRQGLSKRTEDKINRLGLNTWPPVKGPDAERILGNARDTEQKYRDINGDWAKERQQVHQEIIDAHFRDKEIAPEKQAFFTAGGSASGKGSSLFDFGGQQLTLDKLGERKDVIKIDPDAIKAMLPEWHMLLEHGDPYAATSVHEESSYLAKQITQIAYDRGYSVLIDTTGSGDSFVGKIEAAYLRGYKTQVTITSIPTNTAIARSIARGDKTGRYVAIHPLREAHAGASKQFLEWQHDKNISWRAYENSGVQTELVARGEQGRIEVLNEGVYRSILEKRNEVSDAEMANPASALTRKDLNFEKTLPSMSFISIDQIPPHLLREEERKTAKAIAGLKFRIKQGMSDRQLQSAELRLQQLQDRREALREKLGLDKAERLNPYLTKTPAQLNQIEKDLKKKLSADRYYMRKAHEAGRPDRSLNLEKRIAENEHNLQLVQDARQTTPGGVLLPKPLPKISPPVKGPDSGVRQHVISIPRWDPGVLAKDAEVEVEDAMTTLDRIFSGYGDLGQSVQLTFADEERHNFGRYWSNPRRININTSTTMTKGSASSTFWHEFGHYLDYNKFGSGDLVARSEFLPELKPGELLHPDMPGSQLQEWWRAVNGTEAFARVKSASRYSTHARYLATNREFFARSFAQYVLEKAIELRDAGLLSESQAAAVNRAERFEDRRARDEYGTQWTHKDFAPVKCAFDDLFRKRGWLR